MSELSAVIRSAQAQWLDPAVCSDLFMLSEHCFYVVNNILTYYILKHYIHSLHDVNSCMEQDVLGEQHACHIYFWALH